MMEYRAKSCCNRDAGRLLGVEKHSRHSDPVEDMSHLSGKHTELSACSRSNFSLKCHNGECFSMNSDIVPEDLLGQLFPGQMRLYLLS